MARDNIQVHFVNKLKLNYYEANVHRYILSTEAIFAILGRAMVQHGGWMRLCVLQLPNEMLVPIEYEASFHQLCNNMGITIIKNDT